MAKARRTTHRSTAGKKLYAVRDADGKFKDIQTFERAHRADLAKTSKAEAAKGKEAEDGAMARMIEGLTSLVPEAVKTLVVTFGSPILAGLTGPITKYVLDKLKGLG